MSELARVFLEGGREWQTASLPVGYDVSFPPLTLGGLISGVVVGRSRLATTRGWRPEVAGPLLSVWEYVVRSGQW